MNDVMKFFKPYMDRVASVISVVTESLLEDEHKVIHPTIIATELIDTFHSNNEDVLQLGSVYRVTKDTASANVLYLVVVYKRYGRTFKPKKFLVLNNSMHSLFECLVSDSILTTINSIVNTINNNL